MIVRKIYVDGLGVVAQSEGDLSTNVRDLRGRIISARDEAFVRIMVSEDENIGRIEGTRVSMLSYV